VPRLHCKSKATKLEFAIAAATATSGLSKAGSVKVAGQNYRRETNDRPNDGVCGSEGKQLRLG
jgi:hypothetical protein